MALESVLEAIEKAKSRSGRSDFVQLIAVSKGRCGSQIESLYKLGIRDFGENRLQEYALKWPHLPQDIRWHYIGSLQSNKAKQAISGIELIHSIDTLSLAKKLDSLCSAANVTKKVLIQVNCSREPQKHGFLPQDLPSVFSELSTYTALELCGLMTMAACHTDGSGAELKATRLCFQKLFSLRQKLHEEFPQCRHTLKELSMGMSQDFEMAIEEGSTIIRIGRLLFE